MVYKEYDNAELYESNIPCPVTFTLDLKTRNINLYSDQYEMGETRDFAPFATGDVTVLNPSDTFWYVYYYYIVGEGDYIYFTSQDENSVLVNEYQISTGITKTLTLWTYGDGGSGLEWALLSYIEPHKILAAPCNYMDMDPYCVVYILDFEDMSRTTSLSTSDIDEIEAMYVDEIDGHIMMCVIGWLDVGWGWGAYVKDYTAGGDWVYAPEDLGNDFHYSDQWQCDWSIVNHRYLCGYMGYPANYPGGYPTQLQVICFDIYTGTWQESNLVETYEFVDAYAWQVYMTAVSGRPDMTNNKLYIKASGYGWGDYNPPPPYDHGITYGDTFLSWFTYDPSTNTLASIYETHWDAFDTWTMGTWTTTMYSTYSHAYFGYYYDENLYRGDDLSVVGTVDNDYRFGLSLMDDDKILYRYDIPAYGTIINMIDSSGSIVKSWDLSSYGTHCYLRCAGHGIVVEVDDESYSTGVLLLLT